jgi:hypothetical protein
VLIGVRIRFKRPAHTDKPVNASPSASRSDPSDNQLDMRSRQ